jgi:hypothetical protein
MKLLLVAMAASIVLGMVFRKHESVWRVMIFLLSIGVTTAYFVFADSLM